MLRRLLTLSFTFFFLFPLAVAPFASFACNETPRGEQGIDFYADGSYDAGQVAPDAHGPCEEEADPTGICTQAGGPGTLYTHLIVCEAGQSPALIECNALDGGAADGGYPTFCCTTGII